MTLHPEEKILQALISEKQEAVSSCGLPTAS
jgi:hypothetical protein